MKYKAKPVETEAIQFTGENWDEVNEFAGTHWIDVDVFMENFIPVEEMWVDIPEGIVGVVWVEPSKQWAGVKVGDYVVRDLEGDVYPCEKSIFERKYGPLDESTDRWEKNDKIVTVYFRTNGYVMAYTEDANGGRGGICDEETTSRLVKTLYPEMNSSGVVTAEQINRAVGRSIQQSRRFRD